MATKLTRLAATYFLIASSLGQTFVSNIPPQESAALANIVEDDPADVPIAKGSKGSPVYPSIYGVPLPIPPVKQPKK